MALPLGEPLPQTDALDVPALTEQGPNLVVIQGGVYAEAAPYDEVLESADQVKDKIRSRVAGAVATLVEVVESTPTHEPATAEERKTTLTYTPAIPEDFRLKDGWQPGKVSVYESYDPWQAHNPEQTAAVTELIETTMAVTREINGSGTIDPTLTYLGNLRRSNGGKRATVVTQELMKTSEAVGTWISHLPDAQQLTPVAKPWSDTVTADVDPRDPEEGEIIETPLERVQQAIMGGAGDGRGVRERSALLGDVVSSIDPDTLPDNTLVITSIGTGTGEPAMDNGVSVFEGRKEGTVIVDGYDINTISLRIAGHFAAKAQDKLKGDTKLIFNGRKKNILSLDDLKQAVQGARINESLGFSEYVPSENSTDPAEQFQRQIMERMGGVSSEEWHKAVYDNMPVGAVWVTGNMREDSPHIDFVRDGLGWKGIIPRSTEAYLQILSDAGIPSEAVHLYVPGENSARVYNMPVITKLAETAIEAES